MAMIDRLDYTKHWPNVADYSLITWSADQTWQIIHCERPDKFRHNTKQAHLQGVLWNQYTDPIEDENDVIIYTRCKTKTK